MIGRTTLCILIGFILDLLLGDPYNFPHPIRLIGKEISFLEHVLYGDEKTKDSKRLYKGGVLVCLLLISVGGISFLVCFLANKLHWFAGMIVESILCYYVLATKCLKVESMKVYKAIKDKDIEAARFAVSMIVGRDTNVLDETGIVKAAVETVAENTSDGVIAPLFYLCIGGPVLAFIYKAINTMDSMIGYKNDKYLFFGRVAAKLDDVVNFIPARVSAYLMIFASFLLGFDGRGAYQIHKRDARKHASPNSAQTESVCAGALQIQLAGDAIYFGKVVKKHYIGEAIRPVEAEDIPRSNKLLYGTAILMLLLGLGVRVLIQMFI